jgi:hypothetical protein
MRVYALRNRPAPYELRLPKQTSPPLTGDKRDMLGDPASR